MTTMDAHTHTSGAGAAGPGRRGALRALAHRWPAALGLLVALATVGGAGADHVAVIIVLAALVYPAAVLIGSRGSAWPVAPVASPVVALPLLSPIEPVFVMLALAGVVLAAGLVRGRWRPGGDFPPQTLAMIGFAAVALVAVLVDPAVGGYLVAAGLIAHGIWDGIHYWRDRVVSRSYAEFCGVVDLVLGGLVLALLWTA